VTEDYRPPQTAEELTDPEGAREQLPPVFEQPSSVSNIKQIKRRTAELKSKELQEQNDLSAIVSTEAGLRFVVRLLEMCGHGEEQFATEPHFLAQIAGRRSIGIQIERAIKEADLELWLAVERVREARRREIASSGKAGKRP